MGFQGIRNYDEDRILGGCYLLRASALVSIGSNHDNSSGYMGPEYMHTVYIYIINYIIL